jgi:hypothetical protein
MSTVQDHVDSLLRSWDDVDNAAQRVATSLPSQMTEAADRLERARIAHRDILQRAVMAIHKAGLTEEATS